MLLKFLHQVCIGLINTFQFIPLGSFAIDIDREFYLRLFFLVVALWELGVALQSCIQRNIEQMPFPLLGV